MLANVRLAFHPIVLGCWKTLALVIDAACARL